MLERGYYEGLAGNKFNAELWEFFMRPQAADDPSRRTGQGRKFRDDYLEQEFDANSVAMIAANEFPSIDGDCTIWTTR